MTLKSYTIENHRKASSSALFFFALYQQDYYSNGRIEGNFKKDNAIGEFRFYNRDGTLQLIEFHNKRGLKNSNRNIINYPIL